MERILLILIFAIKTSILFGQNLVPNFNFEQYSERPKKDSMLHLLKYWFNPNKGTPDFWVRGQIKDRDNSICNYQKTNGYVGIVARPEEKTKYFYYSEYYEYISVGLIQELKEGKKYQIKCDVYFANKSVFTINQLGMAFTTDSLIFTNSRKINLPFVKLNNFESLIEDMKWITLCGNYVANGGEKYITIGVFQKNDDIKIISKPTDKFKKNFDAYKGTTPQVYLYIDNIYVEEMNSENECNKELIVGQVYPINNINFKFNTADLLPESFQSLDELIHLLMNKSSLKIQINGYADNIGNNIYNLQLSNKRAKAVYDYLISKGIQANRLIYEGYGEKKPLDNNATKKGRATNRRVEFIILQQ